MIFKNSRSFFSNEKKDDNYKKFLHGKDINRYSTTWSGEYINYGKHLAAPRDPRLFYGERILIRRIPARQVHGIIATLTSEEYVNEQSLTNCFNLKVDGKFLLGILNSKLITYWAAQKFDLYQRKLFTQMRAYQMKEFPIPNATDEQIKKLSEIVERMLILNGDLVSKEKISQIEELTIVIDEIVMDLFDLSEEEKEVIRNFSLDN